MASNDRNTARIGLIGADLPVIERLATLDDRLSTANFAVVDGGGQELIQQLAGLLLAGGEYNGEAARTARDVTRRFLKLDRPVLAYGKGAYVLNKVLGGQAIKPPEESHSPDVNTVETTFRNTVFLTVGSKTAMTIGGSGWLTIRDVAFETIPLSNLSARVMPAAITETSEVAAFEEPGRRWTIGVAWDVTRVDKLPSGFGNVLEAFVDRTVG